MKDFDYWEECLANSFEENGIIATQEQLKSITIDIQTNHENYGMAFYSPPSSDRVADIEREWKKRYDDLKREFNKYKENAETAVKKALRQCEDSSISIGEDGEVIRYDGRTKQIQ